MTSKAYGSITGSIFLLLALAHLIRAFAAWDFRIGGWDVPSWVSLIAVAVTGYLSYTGFRLATRGT